MTEKYVPKHRAPGKHKAKRSATQRALRKSVVLTGVAAAATGVAVSSGVVAAPVAGDATDLAAAAVSGISAVDTAAADDVVERRGELSVVSRSDRRGTSDARKVAALSVGTGPVVARRENLATGDPRDIARALLGDFGFADSEFSCLDSLYVSESNWRVNADNPTSSAYGIPQALTRLHDLPSDYMTSAESQIRWGLGYIQDTYGTPCNAWSFKQGNNWY